MIIGYPCINTSVRAGQPDVTLASYTKERLLATARCVFRMFKGVTYYNSKRYPLFQGQF